uniref:Uncharacterized protein n=1 Tax=Tanacetum cinerariifolium TaxID=118510 RepID=A0A699RIY6_TANCI|nr:hypothetical protein [Tanacetum cinerariifolium]
MKRVDFPIVLDVTGLCCDELKASLESAGQDNGGQIAYLCIYKARHNDYQSEAKVNRLETSQSYVADLDDIIPILVQKVKDATSG